MPDAVKFTATKQEMETIVAIVTRTEKLGLAGDRLSAIMDLNATHSNGCPMDFDRMLACEDDFSVMHDIRGIYRHLDRNTGKLTGNFLPRFNK